MRSKYAGPDVKTPVEGGVRMTKPFAPGIRAWLYQWSWNRSQVKRERDQKLGRRVD